MSTRKLLRATIAATLLVIGPALASDDPAKDAATIAAAISVYVEKCDGEMTQALKLNLQAASLVADEAEILRQIGRSFHTFDVFGKTKYCAKAKEVLEQLHD
jgi:hypothetical protein